MSIREEMTTMTPNDGVMKLLVTRTEAAELCAVSARTWDRLRSAGKIPAPVQVGGSPRWSVTELQNWVAAGCPERSVWQQIRQKD